MQFSKHYFSRLAKQLEPIGTYALRRNLLGIALIVCLATLFFPRGERHARWIFEGAILPIGVLVFFARQRPPIAHSTILVACAGYLAAMIAASVNGLHAVPVSILHEVLAAGMIFVFLVATGWIFSTDKAFKTPFMFWLSIVAAVSAGINIVFYFIYLAPAADQPIAAYRLLTTVGMRDYSNSTNISATYAIFFIGAFGTLIRGRLSVAERLALAVASAVLLAGVLLTQSRGAYVGVLVGLVAIIATASPRVRILGLASLVALGLAAVSVPIVQNALTSRGSSYRFEVWQKFAPVIAEHPWLGHGQFSPAGITLHTGQFLDQAHNLVLSAWFRAGIVGALAMAYILLGGLFWTAHYWRVTGDIVPFCVLATIFTAGMVDYQLMITYPTWPWITFWLPFGLAIGAEMSWRRMRPAKAASGQDAPQAGMARE